VLLTQTEREPIIWVVFAVVAVTQSKSTMVRIRSPIAATLCTSLEEDASTCIHQHSLIYFCGFPDQVKVYVCLLYTCGVDQHNDIVADIEEKKCRMDH
jgi:hypothetical protein